MNSNSKVIIVWKLGLTSDGLGDEWQVEHVFTNVDDFRNWNMGQFEYYGPKRKITFDGEMPR